MIISNINSNPYSKMLITCWPAALGELVDEEEKYRGRKSRDGVPLQSSLGQSYQ
jgi:hypothetical protein